MALTLPITSGIPGNTSTTPDYTFPAGIEDGDFLVLIVSNSNTGGTPSWNDTVSGWTLEVNEGDGVSDQHLGIYTRAADGTEGETVVELSQDASAYNCATLLVFRGAVTTGLHTIGSWGTAAADPLTVTAIDTGSTNNCYILGISTFDGSDSSSSGPPYDGFSTATGGWSKDHYSWGDIDGDGGRASHAVFTKTQEIAGSTGNLVVDISNLSDGMGGIQVAIEPAATATFQYARPASDVVSGLWMPNPATAGLYNKIDETVASDADYIYYELGK